jgi:serine/threonine protein phosphatase PrpC
VHCGDSRLYVVRDGELLTRTRDHSYLEQRQRAGAPLERINRNVLFTCLGSPTKPGVRRGRPGALEQGDKPAAVLRRPVGHAVDDDADIVAQLAPLPVAEAVPELVERPCARPASTATTSR